MFKFNYLFISILFCLTACSSTLDKLANVGKAPQFDNIELPPLQNKPIAEAKHEPVIATQAVNSLWQPNSKTFFHDRRAWKVGDIVKIHVMISDSAKLDNASAHNRNGKDSMGVTSLFGKAGKMAKFVSKAADPTKLLDTSSNRNYKGNGNISRKEDIDVQIAAIVTQILGNGNLLLKGKQEVRVNNELRAITVAGIVRPNDINSENTVRSDQIAEARISYGGRGFVSDYQQPPIGNQIIDAISPF